ncbi:MAG: GerMN domain-containing protein [Chloroflexi bacterium]|nr:GerMN domain-containing protein [Chloroflexota bacterium]
MRVRAADRVAHLAVLGALAVVLCACGATPTPPVQPSPTTTTVRVFFVAGGTDPCGSVAPVVRQVTGPVDPALALRELLRGPTDEEAAAGYTSLFGPPTADALQAVTIVDGIAHVSFGDLRPVLPNASSSCGSAALLAALDATLAQLPGIRGARYSFGGDEAAFYEWLQLAPPD